MTIPEIKTKINTILDNSRYGGSGHPNQVYNEIPFKGFEDISVWRNSSSRIKMILDDAGNIKGKRVLDLGCNIGGFCFEFSKRGAKTIGVDIDNECIDIANDISECFQQKASFYQKEVTPNYLEEITGKFDYVLCLSLMNHMPLQGPEFSIRRVFREIERISDVVYFEMGGCDMFPNCPQGDEVLRFLEMYSNFKFKILGRDDVYHRFMLRCEKLKIEDIANEPDYLSWCFIKGNKETPSGYIQKVRNHLVLEVRKPGYYSEHYFDIMNRIKENPHLNVPMVYDVQRVGDEIYILREYVYGEQIEGKNEWLEEDLRDMLSYCRKNNIIHRDFMKQNIIWAPEFERHFLIDWAEASNIENPCKPVLTNKWMSECDPMTTEFDEYMINFTLGELK